MPTYLIAVSEAEGVSSTAAKHTVVLIEKDGVMGGSHNLLHTCTHTYTHTHRHTHTHTHARTHAHAHTHTDSEKQGRDTLKKMKK